MVETLSNLLRSVVALSPPDLLPILYLSLNRLGPPQQGLELGVGDGVLLKAVAQATGKQGVWWQFQGGGLRGRRCRGGEDVRDSRGGSEGGERGRRDRSVRWGERGALVQVREPQHRGGGRGAGKMGMQREQDKGAGTEARSPGR